MLNQNLSQKQLQKLSPQQIQFMKMLQLPIDQLEERIQEEMEINPALEEGLDRQDDSENGGDELENNSNIEDKNDADADKTKEVNEENAWEESLDDLSAYYEDDDTADYKLKSQNNLPDDEENHTIPVATMVSFYEHLEVQLQELELSEKETIIGLQLIGSIDEDGYIRRELLAIADDLAFQQNLVTNKEEIEQVLEKIQKFDPPGIGSRDLKECLLIQINKLKPSDPGVSDAFKIVDEQFDAFIKKHYEKIQKELSLTNEALKTAIGIVLKLNPKPGSGYSSDLKKQQYIVPDFLIQNNNGELELSLNGRNAPDLRVSSEFKSLMRDYDKSNKKSKEQKEAILFIKQKIDSAKWFIDAIQQRQNTLLNTMHAIMEMQKDYFLTGDETKIRPMILKDIAEITKQDISTISRVSNSKYVQTEFGTKPLKYFFSESLSTDSGEEVSSREVKQILQDLIAAEDKFNPLSDQELTDALSKKGYNIARRTVAKYREMLDLPVARLRKEI